LVDLIGSRSGASCARLGEEGGGGLTWGDLLGVRRRPRAGGEAGAEKWLGWKRRGGSRRGRAEQVGE
jgi:hypothetical protein